MARPRRASAATGVPPRAARRRTRPPAPAGPLAGAGPPGGAGPPSPGVWRARTNWRAWAPLGLRAAPCADAAVVLAVCSIKDWDCCSLSLQPCTDPVCTPKGVLYEREAIYEYILKEKTRIAQDLKKWELQQAQKPAEERSKRKMEDEERVRQFEETETGILPPTKSQKTDGGKPEGLLTYTPDFDTLGQKKLKAGVLRAKGNALGHKSLLEGERLAEVAKDSCFWIPDTAPDAHVKDAHKPDDKVRCPISSEPIRLKDLVSVKFTKLDESKDVTKNNSNHNERYMCPITKKTLSNATPCIVLRKSGHCIARDVYDQVIKKDMSDPFGGEKLKEKDIIFLQKGGTGFAAGGTKLEAETYKPAMRAF
jgi:nitric oxide synthase-interacting protein